MTSGAHGLLIFDGSCGFCTSCAQWIARRWPAASGVRAVPSQELASGELAELGLDRNDVTRSVWWCDGNRTVPGHRAIARALIATRTPWTVVGYLIAVPLRWPAALGYRVVARYRHRLPGGTPACAPRPLGGPTPPSPSARASG
jgi:predicted DCC family thiol-disulfide oxidoreductase YuxK